MTEFSALSTADSRSDPPDSMLIAESGRTPERFGALFERHAAEIHGYAARRIGVRAADDLMAETLASGPTLFRPGSASSGSFGRASRGEFSMDEALVQVSKSCTGRS